MSMDPTFVIKVVAITASGALAPGPLTASAVALGARGGWKSGLGIAMGHTLVEFPLVLLLAYGIGAYLTQPGISNALGLVGGAFIVLFSALTFRDALCPRIESKPAGRSAIAAGAALSLFNPFFLAWWAGVGSPLLLEAGALEGILLLYAAHVWVDYAWLAFAAHLGSASRINLKLYKGALFALALAMLYFGIGMLASNL
jgi:threonine/homoserine/homoserine lactone efflux protein